MKHVKTFNHFLNEMVSYAELGPKAKEFAMKCGWQPATADSPQLGDASDKNRDPEERILFSGSKEGMPWSEYKAEQERVNKELDKKYQEALSRIGIPVKELAMSKGNYGDIGGKLLKKRALDLADKLDITYEFFSVVFNFGKWGKQYKSNDITYVIYNMKE